MLRGGSERPPYLSEAPDRHFGGLGGIRNLTITESTTLHLETEYNPMNVTNCFDENKTRIPTCVLLYACSKYHSHLFCMCMIQSGDERMYLDEVVLGEFLHLPLKLAQKLFHLQQLAQL